MLTYTTSCEYACMQPCQWRHQFPPARYTFKHILQERLGDVHVCWHPIAPCRTVRLKVPESLRRHVVGVPLHLRYQDCRQPVDIPNQELRAPVGDRRKLSSNNYSCSALDSILARYLGESAHAAWED